MRIEQIETFLLKAKLEEGDLFYSSQAPFGERASLIVKITTESGISGWGESGVSMPVDHLATYIHEVLAPRLLGRNAEHTGPIWHDLYAFSRDFGRKGASIDAMSGIDTALWDIRGKAADRPIHALMGGAFRQKVRAYATGFYYREEDLADPSGAAARARDEAESHLAQGFSAVKTKVGLLPLSYDIRRMAAVREEVGEDFLLMADANHAYNRHTARIMGKASGFYQ